ncbi:DUF2634 domain-containing protein [Priestia endophytica]|uniref:DUF2634 domain-containing protein n=1 Tax=Priestia endophytica TaxID=135735 RepID=A0AAX1Q679_9BACI|nr:DUF2634 domain-containing protein [Priestia endophytica]RAS75251.1 hypothetical protein A3864_16430 [Priestia endophytica]
MLAPKLKDGDLVIENNNLIMVEDDEELAQSVKSILQTRKGEFFLDTEHGMSFDNILGKVADQAATRDDIIEAVSQEERIRSVTDVSFSDDAKTRIREVGMTLEKEDGTELELEEVVIGA